MTADELKKLIAGGETLTVEFKSDRKGLPDRDLIEAVVALANTEGGVLLLGVEDGTGEITGLHPSHAGKGTPAAMIANRTVPSVQVRVEVVDFGNGANVFAIFVPECRGVVGTVDGYFAKRRLKLDGSPETIPMTPFEIQSRASQFQLIDPSAQAMAAVPLSRISPLQRERVRASIRTSNNSDKALLELSDSDFDRALGLVKNFGGTEYLTLSGVLIMTDEQTIRDFVPTYEVAFQVLKDGLEVSVNDYMRKPLVEAFDCIVERFSARIEEDEQLVGGRRRAAPNYDISGFREALVNALVHRDYAVLGAVIVKIDHYGLSFYNPGGFIEGVNLGNLLSTAPKSRNTLLADIAKRIGLAERTGRGVDKIFSGVLRYGRHRPEYEKSDGSGVTLTILSEKADFCFLNFVLEKEEALKRPLTVDELLILSELRFKGKLSVEEGMALTQRKRSVVQEALSGLLASGDVVEMAGDAGLSYELSPATIRAFISGKEQRRMNGESYEKYKAMVRAYIKTNGSAKRKNVAECCRINLRQAGYIVEKMLKEREIVQIGSRRWAIYKLA